MTYVATPDCLLGLSTVESCCICRHNMERASFFTFAQICSLSVEVYPNLMDKWINGFKWVLESTVSELSWSGLHYWLIPGPRMGFYPG